MLNINLSNYIEKKVDKSQMQMYIALSKKGFIDYSYRNFSKKLKENNLSAIELLAIAYEYDIDINAIVKMVRRFDKSRKEKELAYKIAEEVHEENIEKIIEKLKELGKVSKGSFQNMIKYTKHYGQLSVTAICDFTSNDALLICSNHKATYGEIPLYLIDLYGFYEEKGYDISNEYLSKFLISDLKNEYDSLKALGLIEDTFFQFNFCIEKDKKYGKKFNETLPDKINGYDKIIHFKFEDDQASFENLRNHTYLGELIFSRRLIAAYGKKIEDQEAYTNIIVLDMSNYENENYLTYNMISLDGIEIDEDKIGLTKEEILDQNWLNGPYETILSLELDLTTPEEVIEVLKEKLN